MSSDPHGLYERAIFQRFIDAGALSISPSSVEKLDPPAPDLRCVVEGAVVDFELVEVVDSDFARAGSEQDGLEAKLKTFADQPAHPASAAVRSTLANALVWVRFNDGAMRDRAKSMPALFEFLSTLPATAAGAYQVGAEGGCGSVRSVAISRGRYSSGPFFQVTSSMSIADPIMQRFRDKWSKHYETDHDVQLLVFYNRHPPGSASLWLSDVEEFLRSNWSTSPFARVWVMDAGEARILLDLSRESK